MKKKILALLLIATTSLQLCACSDNLTKEMLTAMQNNQTIVISTQQVNTEYEQNKYNWIELGQLNTFKKLRDTWDSTFGTVIFDHDSKNGVLFVGENGAWDGNNTLYNTFRNKYFIMNYWDDAEITYELANAAMQEFKDVDNEQVGKMASINAYYNIMPTNKDGSSGMSNYMSRAQAMAAFFRIYSPVRYIDVNKDFETTVGTNDNNMYAQNISEENLGYLTYTNESLNYTTYNQPMTKAELLYMIMHKWYADELSAMGTDTKGLAIKNAGDIAKNKGFIVDESDGAHAWQSFELEYCIQNQEDGLTYRLYNPIALAVSKGICTADIGWNDPITEYDLLSLSLRAIQKLNDVKYATNEKIGNNRGVNYFAQEQEEAGSNVNTTEIKVAEVKVADLDKDITDINNLVDMFGDEIDMSDAEISELELAAMGFTFEPINEYKMINYCYWLNVRIGPSTDFRIIKSVKSGTQAHIVGRCIENGWYRVIADGKIAYQCGAYFSDLESDVKGSK